MWRWAAPITVLACLLLPGASFAESPGLRRDLKRVAQRLKRRIDKEGLPIDAVVAEGESTTGGGSLPAVPIPTYVVNVAAKDLSAQDLAGRLRQHGTPVIARYADGDRLFVMGYRGQGPDLQELLVCLDAATGELIWERAFSDFLSDIIYNRYAIGSPTVDPQTGHIYAMTTPGLLVGFDRDGKLLWQKDFGVLDANFYSVPTAQFGFASSPIIHDGMVLMQCDVKHKSFVGAFNVETGEEIWRTKRRDVPAWSTPTVCSAGGRTQMVVNGFKQIAGYDLATGKRLWKMHGTGDIPVPRR